MKKHILVLGVLIAAILTPPALAKGRLQDILSMAERNCPIQLESALESFQPETRPLTIKSGRLTLRVSDPDNSRTLRRAMDIYTHPEVMKMSGDYLDEDSVRDIQRMGLSSPDQLRGHSMVNFSISTVNAKGEETIIGFAQLARTDVSAARMKGQVTNPERWFEISYHLHPDFWGQGFATEIATLLVTEAMNKYNAEGVYAQTRLNNNGSGNALKKAGLVEIERSTNTIHYSITRDQFLNPPLKHGINIRTTEKNGQKMISLIVVGEVQTWTRVKIDQNTDRNKMPFPARNDRFVQLTDDNYVSAPRSNLLGGTIYTSALEVDQLIANSIERRKVDPRRLGFIMEQRWGDGDLHGDMFERAAERVPHNFLDLTVFEKKQVYEAMAKEVARTPTPFKFGAPFRLVILNASGVDLLTREQIVK